MLTVFRRGLAVAVVPAALGAQDPPSVRDNYAQARAILDRAIERHGGLAAMRAATRVGVSMRGQDHWRNQSPRVAPPYATEPWTGDILLDLDGNRLVWRTTSHFPGGFNNATRQVVDGTRSLFVNEANGTHGSNNQTIASQRAVLNRLPHLVLLAALDNAPSLRSLGRGHLSSGAPVDLVVAQVGPSPLTLGFDPANAELRAILGVQADVLVGDAASEVELTAYRRVGGILIPGRRVTRVGGEVTQDLAYEAATLEPVFPDSLLGPPPGSMELPPAPPLPNPVQELASGVWAVRSSGYWCLVVAFRDHVLVVEAPGAGVPELIRRVRELAPGRPIRYAAPTHHHDDHAGGARHFMAIGATLVTTPGNRGYFERMARAHSTLRPDSLSAAPRPPRIELVDGKRRVFTDGTRTVELIDIGPIPHAGEMLVAWVPESGILFQGDLFNLPAGVAPPRGTTTVNTRALADWIRARGLDVKVLAGVHMAPGTVAQMHEALQREGRGPR
jgi:glyoxylase-like metal-dependent hydrolase (beta-lactamase superfamily II)